MAAAGFDAAEDAWVIAHALVRRFGYGIASDIVHATDWCVFDERWIAADGNGGWLRLDAVSDDDDEGGWGSTTWLWDRGWVVSESSMSDWAFFRLRMMKLRVRVRAGFRCVSF